MGDLLWCATIDAPNNQGSPGSLAHPGCASPRQDCQANNMQPRIKLSEHVELSESFGGTLRGTLPSRFTGPGLAETTTRPKTKKLRKRTIDKAIATQSGVGLHGHFPVLPQH
jgi:hypothetical protein